MLAVKPQEQATIFREPLQNDTCLSRRVFFLREPIHQIYYSSEAAERFALLAAGLNRHHQNAQPTKFSANVRRPVHALLGVLPAINAAVVERAVFDKRKPFAFVLTNQPPKKGNTNQHQDHVI
jgi:hypothetical protein